MENTAPSIRKCQHGVYWPDGHTVALCCQACNPPKVLTREEEKRAATFQFPQASNDLLNVNDRLHANNSDPDLGACPKCGSRLHFAFRKKYECADCGTFFKAPRAHAAKQKIAKLRIEEAALVC